MAEHLLTVRELATAWNCDDLVVIRLIKRGELRAVKVGQHWRIRPGDARAYLESPRDRFGRVVEPA